MRIRLAGIRPRLRAINKTDRITPPSSWGAARLHLKSEKLTEEVEHGIQIGEE
jgi:hypothetical protein